MAKRGRATVVDVARAAGVSVGTVSHVLSGRKTVRPETRARVEQAIRELGFRPNSIARSLTRQRTQTIGMVVPDVTNPFFADLIWEVERSLSDAEHAVVFGNSGNEPQREHAYLESFLARRVDGLIIAITGGADLDFIYEVASEVPTVFVDRPVDPVADMVVGDNRAGMALAIAHLIELGHRRIGFIDGDPELGTAQERRAGVEAALAAHGLAPTASSSGQFTLASGYEQARTLLTNSRDATAICTGNDLLAMGTLTAAAELGIRIPDDLSLIGYDDITYAAFTSPPLTTVRQPGAAMGEETVRLLASRLAAFDGPPRRVVLEPELIVRGSTAAPGAAT